ncbi:hypothetical protein AB1N83_006298 [Pleurotus pulmonarius]
MQDKPNLQSGLDGHLNQGSNCCVLSDNESVATVVEEGQKLEAKGDGVLRTLSGIDVVRRLVQANSDTYEYLRVFCETYKSTKHCWHPHCRQREMHAHVVEEAGVYIDTVNTSLRIAENGAQTSRGAQTLLVDSVIRESVVESMLEKAEAVKRDVKIIFEKFRGIRISLYTEMKRIDPAVEPHWHMIKCPNVKGQEVVRPEELKSMGQGDLLRVTMAVLDYFVRTVGDFVDWWNEVHTHVGMLKDSVERIRKDPAIADFVRRQWETLEGEYRRYALETMAQQDYYHRVLGELRPVEGRFRSRVRRYLP